MPWGVELHFDIFWVHAQGSHEENKADTILEFFFFYVDGGVSLQRSTQMKLQSIWCKIIYARNMKVNAYLNKYLGLQFTIINSSMTTYYQQDV